MGGIARRTLLNPTMCLAMLCLALYSGSVAAQGEPYVPAPSNYGGVGLMDTRTARFLPDGYLSLTTSFTEPDDRYAVIFQGLPWAEFTFRYSVDRGFPDGLIFLHDRSFDMKLRLANEKEYIPELALGFQDILGTGVYSGEYFVGSKRWGPLDLSLGLGWGRLGSSGTFANPFTLFGDQFRTRRTTATGVPLFKSYFRGPDIGLFGGISYETPIEGLTLKIEYSSDRYLIEKAFTGRDYGFPINFGVSYRPEPWLDIGLSLMHGREVGLRISTLFDPGTDLWPARIDPPRRFRDRAPQAETLLSREPTTSANPSASRPETRYVDLTQPAQSTQVSNSLPSEESEGPEPASPKAIPAIGPSAAPPGSSVAMSTELVPDAAARIKAAMEDQQLAVFALSLDRDTLKIVIGNAHYLRDAEAIARTARVLSAEVPSEIEIFEITTLRAGLPLTTVTLPRTHIDNLARRAESPAGLFQASDLKPASNDTLSHGDLNLFPRFGWSSYPLFRQSFFDPNHPVYVEFGVGAGAYVELARGWSVEGSTAISLYDDFDQIERTSNSVLPHVRSDVREYLQQGTYRIENLTTSYFFKLYRELYGRATAGYIERMFAGIGGELLYRPFRSRWALGLDLWAVQQRGFDVLFALRPYQAFTGHLTAYYTIPWHDLQLAASIGQYLAGDRGATFQIARRFSTGITIGAWVTLTNVSAERFGEGSFDKGIRIIIPFEWGAPFRTQSAYGLELRPIQRDGGQRLAGDAILYDITDSSDYGQILQQWNSVFGR